MDVVKIALIVSIVALVVGLVTAIVVAVENAGSRNLALAVGALGAAMILFLIQLPFELQRSISRDRISTELTIDRAKPSIRQWIYSVNAGWRINAETGASAWLATNNPAAFDQDRDRVTSDLTLFSLVSFLAYNEFDWQLIPSNQNWFTHGRRRWPLEVYREPLTPIGMPASCKATLVKLNNQPTLTL